MIKGIWPVQDLRQLFLKVSLLEMVETVTQGATE